MADSYIKNCLFVPREGDAGPLFEEIEDGAMIVRLDGYAIIPMDKYDSMLAALKEIRDKADPYVPKTFDWNSNYYFTWSWSAPLTITAYEPDGKIIKKRSADNGR